MAMTVGRRIVVGFAIPLILMISVAAVGYLALQRLTVQLQELSVQQDKLLIASRETRAGARDAERTMLDYLLTGNPNAGRQRQAYFALVDSGMVRLRQSPGVQAGEVDSLVEQLAEWRRLTDQVLSTGERQGLDAARRYRDQQVP